MIVSVIDSTAVPGAVITVVTVVITILSNKIFFQRCFKRVIRHRLKYFVRDTVPDGRAKNFHRFLTVVVITASSV